MPGYADLDEAQRRLNLVEGTHDEELAQLVVLDAALSALFDEATGRTFDGAAATATQTVEAPGISDLLILPVPVRTITSVVVGGAWDGATWTGATTLDADAYRTRFGSAADGWLALERVGGLWWFGPTRVTGTWGDDPGDGPPALVVAAVTTAVIREYRRATATPDGEINFEEEGIPAPSGLTDPLWKQAVKTYRVDAHALVV